MTSYTAESVTFCHPDKICDQISDAIVDECLRQDENSRVAIEVVGGHGIVVLMGEVTTKAITDFSSIAKKVYFDLMGKEIGVLTNIVKQSPDISQGVDYGGAGDQGIMIGYACTENEMRIPQEMYLARKLLEPFVVDGKSQVTIDGGKVTEIVLSVQGKTQEELLEYVGGFMAKVLPDNVMPDVYCNNTGAFNLGGFDADSGVTGRKIVVDAYGPRIPVGGGAFSGKDPTKVDRSGAYMARWIALQNLYKYEAEEVLVKLAYVIGKSEPIMAESTIQTPGSFGSTRGSLTVGIDYDCRPDAIIERFDLRKPIYQETAKYGSFGRNYPWETL